MIATKPRFTKFRGIDLYCGAGGMSTGAEQSGYVRIDLAVNHWRPAIMTHSANHKHTRHICAEMEHVDPENDATLPVGDIVMAGVECTHHSNAKGDAPVSDQKRSSANDVLRWVRAQKPKYLIIENVREFRDWGRTKLKRDKNSKKIWDAKHDQWARVADPRFKGEYFRKWVADLESLGYRVEHRLLNAADFGERTKRIRLVVIAARDFGFIPWAKPTHSEHGNGKPRWGSAAEIIDWDRPIPSIFGRPRPLVKNSLERVKFGLCKFNAPKTITDALEGSGFEPFIVKYRGTSNVASVDDPLPTVTGGGNHLFLAMPYLVNLKGRSNVADCRQPLPTVTAHARHLCVAQPFIVKYHGGKDGHRRGASIHSPLPTIDTNPRFALAQPFIVGAGGPTGSAKPASVYGPLGTVMCHDRKSLVVPFLFNVDHASGNGAPHSVHGPMGTLTSKQRHGLVKPFVYQLIGRGAGRSYDIDSPLPTITAARETFGVVAPFLIPNFGERPGQLPRTHSVFDPLPAVTSHGAGGVVVPYLIDVNHGESNRSRGGRVHRIENPLGTITGKRSHGLIKPQPFIVNYYGTGIAHSTEEPLSTVTTKHRHGLTLFGDPKPSKKLIVLNQHEASLFWAMRLFGFDDILFRMLDVDELAKAMGLPDNYFLYGTKAEQVKQVGNAVSVRMMKAICLALGEYEMELALAA